ncbi:tRNA/rRNA cytosine-C5-methylase [Encephalitozoon hellem ATCC 50504]|uniref:NOL1/NOP2/sun-like protein n=1 Tax=Encephalitozoon hellem TaxID=27973 RepID=A0A9Q9CD74_ENCHE|nr:tRNA/rRNA cytosine-C5-methylase [Encephalitozoon hellem ATCC 50504]AFM98737.1 tRNA/rRNA cytosine-C5-methylase [Encephalitozoon hellem ATCC 50504]UTX43713.1 NOL1/NOP2/sun-like protein [Encephalitozoon hellem]|eukprot:XP_003887718.1 tRNA/rRNA cytosine-C5-methylase [Encephalitozoon hellem ATCC 50504]
MPRSEYMEYYKRVLAMEPDDFEEFDKSVGKDLAYAFRVTNTPLANMIKSRIEQYPFVRRIKCLENVYEFHKKKEKDDEYRMFTSFLINQTSVGLIQRQEIVSMIPVLLMDLKEDSKVIDMCAAPGSKTKQILEVVTKGLVIANDANGKRIKVLVSETAKKPNGSLIVTKHDATAFPKVYEGGGLIRFDRVFCDVVCSSDGTVRKSPGLLDGWKVSRSTSLFDTQLKILRRGCSLAAKGGLVSYSTCSLNPIENECVVQKVLLEGEFELVDFRGDPRLSLFPAYGDGTKIVFREGLKKWETSDKIFKNPNYRPSDVDLGLEKCIRFYPHDQDTGGFFVAILRKKDGIEKAMAKREAPDPSFKRFIFFPSNVRDDMFKTYSMCMDGELYKKTERSRTISFVTGVAARVLSENPGLNVISAGYRILEKSGLANAEFYLKNLFHAGGGFECNLVISLDQFKLLLNETFVDNTLLGFEHIGLAICKIEEMGITLCGYGSHTSFTLFMNNNLRKALKDLIL